MNLLGAVIRGQGAPLVRGLACILSIDLLGVESRSCLTCFCHYPIPLPLICVTRLLAFLIAHFSRSFLFFALFCCHRSLVFVELRGLWDLRCLFLHDVQLPIFIVLILTVGWKVPTGFVYTTPCYHATIPKTGPLVWLSFELTDSAALGCPHLCPLLLDRLKRGRMLC
jgi:hypothetical protein